MLPTYSPSDFGEPSSVEPRFGGAFGELDHLCRMRHHRDVATRTSTVVAPARVTKDVRRIFSEGGHDLSTVGMAGNDRRAILQGQDVPEPGDFIGQRGQRKLRCADVVPVHLQALDDAVPTRPVGPCPMNQNDVRSRCHQMCSSSSRTVSEGAPDDVSVRG